ncbi:MAG: RluA family pseudouridine synthase [Xenococcaceae cyanobacterium MO_234.B1]|nr:RluA family pseudouridine synthase [Xenococcaceae cyanobacterium MO_234.B1]
MVSSLLGKTTETLELQLQVTDKSDVGKPSTICDRAAPLGDRTASLRERLDRWLSTQLPDISRSRLQKLIEDGHVQVNNRVCRSKKLKLVLGDRVSLRIPSPQKLDLQPEAISLDIIYEDAELIIINKPAGMVVHPAPGHYQGTLVNALLHHCDNLAGIGGVERPGIVHRLDKDTTGAIVVAKSDRAHQYLQSQIKAKTARREYWGVVYGCPREEKGKIELPIGRHPVERKKMAIVPVEKGGREAVTYWEIKERLGNYTLMQFLLETGRTHQIRVHCSHLGHPLVGDTVYGSNRSIGVNLSGQVLHARKLTLVHPVSEEIIEAIAPFPDEFTKLLSVLRSRI